MPQKVYKIKPTRKCKLAIKNMVDNGGIVSRAMLDAGYSPATAKNPTKLTSSEGYKIALREYGLTEGLIAESLVEDIKKKPADRCKELNLGARILGMVTEKTETKATQTNINISDESFKKILAAYTERNNQVIQVKS